MRRDFMLPEADVDHLQALGRPWEAVVEGGAQWLLVHGWPLPASYNHPSVSIAVRIEAGYPEAQLDMVYVLPHLARADGLAINNLTNQSIDGKDWQRWSRHRTNTNPWRPGVDDLAAHLFLVDDWFAREFMKRAA